jgi:hypothetical protein
MSCRREAAAAAAAAAVVLLRCAGSAERAGSTAAEPGLDLQ